MIDDPEPIGVSTGKWIDHSYPANAGSLYPLLLVDRIFLEDSRNDWCEIKRQLDLAGFTSADAYPLIGELCKKVHMMLKEQWSIV